MKSREFKNFLDRYLQGKATPEEEQLIDQWYSRIGQDHHELVSDKKALEKQLWSAIEPVRNSRFWSKRMAIAAAVSIICLVSVSLYFSIDRSWFQHDFAHTEPESQNEISDFTVVANNQNTSRKVTLYDGSEVTLKPGSSIKFPKIYQSNKREVFLSGEAFFSVKRDETRPFFVYSKELVTKVLGTSFNVKAYADDEEITVAVRTGKVSVFTKHDDSTTSEDSSEAVILTPNQRVVYNRESERVSKLLVEKPEVVLPKPTLFMMKYDGAPVSKIFDVLEENYGVDIDYDADVLEGCVLTTSMSDEGLYERIEVICKAINAEYTVEDAVIVIKAAGCK